ncbi:probable low-specificity L-threonine aldolase 2 [Hordeum vulgare subsp. vulgare]|uniref:low-specificity L-threonine aldolase n=1 Tax=Hordeum vulgare subsp. vulgare TaxID=112509 RepID=A0A8I6Y4S9_HORVV|nr:probable low-specificity L-threonine aldolase 2 [Hordeum vulgare subsp. vulgare]
MATKAVDLRSDTVTKPSEAMRAAMAAADVEDDILGSDPTARRFEAEMARIMGKEAALFVPSGTMANLISVLVHCDTRGSEVILGDNSHIHVYEHGGISTLGGVHPKTIPNDPDGTMDIDKIVAAVRSRDGSLYYPITRLVCLENTQGNCGGKCLSVEYTDKVGEVAKTHGLKLHIDGARIFNASAALGVPVDRLVRAADSVSVGLAKGIGAPIGSVIVGSKAFIHKATILRKTLGGGIRQVGILCAAAEVAVRDTVGKLADDHRKAKVLADGLKKIEHFTVDLASVETNLVFFDMADARISPAKLCQILEQRNVLATPIGSKSVRLAVHYQISDGDVQYTLKCIEEAVEEILTCDAKLDHLTNGATTNS